MQPRAIFNHKRLKELGKYQRQDEQNRALIAARSAELENGIPESRLATLFEHGIGVSNVNERLKVLFGQDYPMWNDSKPGEGTRTGIEIPEVQVANEELTTA